jgi:hypothetical protein
VSVAIREWLDLLRGEYLEDFIAKGSSGVKFAVIADEAAAVQVKSEVRQMAERLRYLVVSLDAAKTRVHLMQHVFHEIARQAPWEDLARRIVRRCYQDLGITCGDGLGLEEVASANQMDPRFLRKDLRRVIDALIGRSQQLAKDFRYAMIWMCADQAAQWDSGPDSRLILEWLTGDLRLASALKRLYIFQKIGRHNARAMLSSLSAWCRLAGLPGLVLLWDIRPLGQAARVDVGDSVHYSAAAAMDAYEVLRQLIDASDELAGMLCVVVAHPELLEDEKRGVKVYKALYERIWPDVRLRRQDNPLSALITLAAAGPVAAL